MLYEFKYEERFSYPKTLMFWSLLTHLLESLSENTYDYATIVRDKTMFELGYSYGLTIQETLNLSVSDISPITSGYTNEFSGTIYINRNNTYRLVQPMFNTALEQLKLYLDIYDVFFKTSQNKSLFKTINGNPLTINYLNKRLNLYNLKISYSHRITTIHAFRQFYISDILRFKKVPYDFINNQIGNNITYNPIFYSYHPFNV